LAESKHLQLDLDLQPALCLADPGRISQVITNLLTNAIHFIPDRGTIVLQTHRGEEAHFSLQDSGSGIPPEQMPNLFHRFLRGDASRTRTTGGNGLGLAICKAIVDVHGGKISAKSEVGTGSTFEFSLK
jgi:two-component system, OmpR family, sensor histidine kinase BaeS